VTVLTTLSGAPWGISASISKVTFTVRADQGVKVSDHFFGNTACVAAHPGGIEIYTPVEASGLRRFLRGGLLLVGNAGKRQRTRLAAGTRRHRSRATSLRGLFS